MMRLVTRSLQLSWIAIALLSAFCVGSQFVADRALAADPSKPVLPANPREINLWMRALGNTKLPPPWRVAPCANRSKSPLLCVYEQQTLVGTVEMGTFLISSRVDLRQKLTKAGIPERANYAEPQYRSKVAIALKAWVEDYYAFFKSDRQVEYGNNITFTSQPPAQVAIGKITGFRYGFSGIKQENKSIHEQRLGYVAFDGATLYVITTAFDATSETGKFKTLEAFQRFEPHLTRLVAGLQLPIAKPAR